jgi:hypothetical protein
VKRPCASGRRGATLANVSQDVRDKAGEIEPAPLPLFDRWDAAGWTGETRRDDFYSRGRRVLILPAVMLIILVGLAADSRMFLFAVALPLLVGFIYLLIAYQANHLRLRITKALTTISFAPLWQPTRKTLPTAQLRGFEVVEIKAWVSSPQERVEVPLWEIIAVTGSDVLVPVHIWLAFRQPAPAVAVVARLNWVLSQLRDKQ